MLPRDSIYCEALFSPQDIYYEGSEDEDYDDAEARRQRYEAAGQQFLAGRVPMLLSATLKGPFEEDSGWVNPWRSKNRTAHLQHQPESQSAVSQYGLRRATPSASASPAARRQAIEILKNAECALPSPESLKQAPFTEARSCPQGKVSSWRDEDISLSSSKDGYESWAASSPSSRKLGKRKSKSSIVMDSTGKRRRVESSEREIETPTSGRRRTRATNVGEQHTKAFLHTSSIYSHIRELTSKLPRQQLSSEDGDSLDSDDDEALISPSSADSPSTNLPPTSSDHEGPTSSSDDASTTHNAQSGFMDGLEASYEIPNGFITPFRATPPTRMVHPIIYDDAEGSNDSSPDSSITALSNAQQLIASQSEAANLARDASGNDNLTKTNSPPKSSALQSLSPRNGRINSRLAPNKIAQPYNSSPVKSSAAVDKALYLQEEDSQQSKENVESMETKENPLPQTMKTNLPISRPNLSEIATDYTCKADCSKADKAQEELMARDAVAPSTTSLVSHLPIEAASPTEMNTAQSNVILNTQDSEEPSLAQEEVSANSQPALPMEENAGLDIPETPTTRDMSEKATNTELTAVLADDHTQTRQQEQENQILTPTEASESLVIPPQSIDTQQPSSEDLPPPTEPVSKRQSTPEPQFAFTSFSSFMSPSPSHRRQIRYSSDKTYNGVASTSHGILVSSKNRAWRGTTPKKRVSWAPLPHEETDGSGDKVSSETDTSSSLSRGRDRAVSPPPPPSTSLASDSLTNRDMKFGDHFAAVADRSKGTQPQSVPTASGHGSCSLSQQAPVTAVQTASPTGITSPPRVNPQREEKGAAKVASSGWDDDNEPTDIVQDIFNEMDDFLQVWDVDAELDEARKAEKAQAAASKKKVETLSEFDMDMGMGMDMDMTALF
ncbi:hypothetical protein TrVGV298_009926 [Trichoderma virens]|nr:hypothetical protein TrVGV298_009926 [Trichoderma virens]